MFKYITDHFANHVLDRLCLRGVSVKERDHVDEEPAEVAIVHDLSQRYKSPGRLVSSLLHLGINPEEIEQTHSIKVTH